MSRLTRLVGSVHGRGAACGGTAEIRAVVQTPSMMPQGAGRIQPQTRQEYRLRYPGTAPADRILERPPEEPSIEGAIAYYTLGYERERRTS